MFEKLRAIGRVRRRYIEAFGRPPELLNPQRFSEKIQWRKLFDRDPRFKIFCDKLAVREFIAQRIGPDHLVHLQWAGVPNDIPFAMLEYPCVLKSTHASGHILYLTEENRHSRDDIVVKANAWMAVNYGRANDEIGYCDVPPNVMVERLITNDRGEAPDEHRLFVFDGRVAFINTVFTEDGRLRNGAFHTPDWHKLDWYFTRKVERPFEQPEQLKDMIWIAENLGRDLDHVRVDFFDCGRKIFISEMTLYSWSGLSKFNPDEADFALGAPWRLKHPVWRALSALVLG